MILQENPHKPTDEKYQSGCLGVATHNDYGGRNTNLFDLGKRFFRFFQDLCKASREPRGLRLPTSQPSPDSHRPAGKSCAGQPGRYGYPMSTIADRILQDLKTAMKAKDPLTTTVLRNLKSALKYAAIEQGGANTELDEAQTQAVIRKEIKKREDAIESFTKGGRPELAEQERREAEILLGYLPAAFPEQEVQSIIDEVIQTQGATSRKDMGSVMKAVQERTGGAVDNKTLSQMVMAKLGS